MKIKADDLVEVVGGDYVYSKPGTIGKIVNPGHEVSEVDFSLNEEILKESQRNLFSPVFTIENRHLKLKGEAKFGLTLPLDSNTRKNYPLLRGCLKYFPAALAGVAKISKDGNDKHNPGEEMHHARHKSADHGDCVIRHLIDTEDLLAAAARGDTSVKPEAILNEVSQLAWRALALSQELHEKFGSPLAPGAKK